MEQTVVVGEAIAGRTAEVRKRLRILANDLERNMFDLGELFLEAQEKHYAQSWGYESLGDYAQTELGVKSRRAQYLSRIVKVMRICGIKRADYAPTGVSKLRSICSLDPESTYFNQETKEHESMAEHITALVAEGPELSTKEVEEKVAALKGQVGDDALITRSYTVTRSCYENVIQRCFEAVRKKLGSAGRDETGQAKEYTDGVCLEALCADFLSDPRNFMEEEDCSHDQLEVTVEEDQTNTGLQVPSEQ